MIVNSLKIKRSLKEGDNAVDKTDSSFHSVFMRLTCSFLFCIMKMVVILRNFPVCMGDIQCN